MRRHRAFLYLAACIKDIPIAPLELRSQFPGTQVKRFAKIDARREMNTHKSALKDCNARDDDEAVLSECEMQARRMMWDDFFHPPIEGDTRLVFRRWIIDLIHYDGTCIPL